MIPPGFEMTGMRRNPLRETRLRLPRREQTSSSVDERQSRKDKEGISPRRHRGHREDFFEFLLGVLCGSAVRFSVFGNGRDFTAEYAEIAKKSSERKP